MLPMTLEDLIAEARLRLDDDAIGQNKWSDEDLTRFANEAERQACLRARLIRDDYTDSITLITLVAGTAHYVLHGSVFEVEAARVEETSAPIWQRGIEQLDQSYPTWRAREGSTPTEFVIEPYTRGRLRYRAVPIPATDADDTPVRLTVLRFPRVDMCAGAIPEIAPQHHMGLVDWMVHRAYLQRDADRYDPAKAAEHAAAFTESFGELPDANVRRKHAEKRNHVVMARSF